MKLLHTADWQIGMRAAHAGSSAPEVREARLRAAERVVDEANRRGVELLLLAGDTFEDNAVDPVLVRRVVDLLRRASCPVFVLPGNHDPLGPGSVYRHPAWSEAAPRVRVLDSTAPIELAGAVLLPCPCASKSSSRDPTLEIPPRAAGDHRLRIGVAHGSLRGQGFEVAGDDFPIAADAQARAGVDYLALGHWHSTLVLPSPAEARLAYPGTHEPTKFGERASGHALEVTLEAGAAPRAEVIATGTLTWHDRSDTLVSDEDVSRLRAELESLPAPERTLVRLQLDGLVSRDGAQAVEILEETLRARFLSVRVERDALSPRPDDAAAWVGALPDGVARKVAERLLAEAAAADVARERRETALEALTRLVAFARRAEP